MELCRARSIFRLRERTSEQQLTIIFRSLVKKYHPDRNPDYKDWAHQRMTEINEAYETLLTWISKPPSKKKKAAYETSPEYQDDFEKESFRTEQTASSLHNNEEKELYKGFNTFLDGLGTYYEYGLENPDYRTEGIRRFRFRDSIRQMKNGFDSVAALKESARHPAVKTVVRFIHLILADIENEKPRSIAGKNPFDIRFRVLRKKIDAAIKEMLFPEMVPNHLKLKNTAGLYACYMELVNLSKEQTDKAMQKRILLQTARYNALLDLMETRNQKIIRF